MAVKKSRAQIGTLVGDVEALAKRLRVAIRTQAAAVPKELKILATRMRKQAALAAAQVEKYAHEIRMELEAGAPKRRSAKSSRAKRR